MMASGYRAAPKLRPPAGIPPIGPLDLSVAFAMLSLSLGYIMLDALLSELIFRLLPAA